MNRPSSEAVPPVFKARFEMIESCGRLAQLLGLPRSTGQIYGLLQFSTRPLCLDEIAAMLGISKASSSTGTRELCSLNAVRLVWVHGDRKDHFEVEPELANVLRGAYNEFFKRRVVASKLRLEALGTKLDQDFDEGAITSEEHKILAERVKRFIELQKKLQIIVTGAEKAL